MPSCPDAPGVSSNSSFASDPKRKPCGSPRGANPNGNTTIDLHDNEHRIFAGNRRTQIDMRFAKVLRFGATRADIGVDVANLLNTNYATGFEDSYEYSDGNVDQGGSWGQPTAVYAPRFVRLNFTVNF